MQNKTRLFAQTAGALGAVGFALGCGTAQAQSYGNDIGIDAAKKVAAGTIAECAKAGTGSL